MKSYLLAISTLLVFGGCDPDMLPELDQPDAEELGELEPAADTVSSALDITTAPLATTWGWTPYTSEEYPPIACEASLVNGFGCRGSYCDNSRMYCSQVALQGGNADWTPRFSEEAPSYRVCDDRYWMVGLSCSGRYCDNLSLQCRLYADTTPRDCYWTGWVSEEGGGTLFFGSGYYARGVMCSGSYCDNKRFYVCRL